MTHPHNEAPVNPLPPAVWALFLVLAGTELAFNLGARGFVGGRDAVGWRTLAQERFGFSDRVWSWMVETGQWPVEHLIRFLAYPFVHVSLMHALFALVLMLALGKIVGEALGNIAFTAIFFASSAGGALLYALLLDDPQLLLGAYPGVYGLIGGFTYLMWLRLGAFGAPQIQAFSLIGLLLFVQLVFGLFFGGDNTWVADVGGFLTGFALSVVLVPGGMARLMAKLRR